MKIGYACIAIGVPDTKQRSCRKINAAEETLIGLIRNNLRVLSNIIDYNIKNNIFLFRISSDLIPFGSSPVNTLLWSEMFKSEFEALGYKIKKSGMRVSMHPGQYTVLNSNDDAVVKRAVEDLNYHALILDSMALDETHKLILHIGGVYQDKQKAVQRFKQNYKILNERVKKRLVIENDDKSYCIEDVLAIGKSLGIPVVFDNLHHAVNPAISRRTECDWVNICKTTWNKRDGAQKIHYSQQDVQKKSGAHSDSIKIDTFMNFFDAINRQDIDIMLEVKDKNLSAVKCINCMTPNIKKKALEVEWSKYKYAVLEKSQVHYAKIRTMLSERNGCMPVDFYRTIEEALDLNTTIGSAVNAAQHVWGYFKKSATEKEKEQFLKLIEKAEGNALLFGAVKKFLWRLVLKYEQPYLMYSYYFLL